MDLGQDAETQAPVWVPSNDAFGIFVSATAPTKKSQMQPGNDTCFFPQFNLKMRLTREMFGGPRKILRIKYESSFLVEQIMRCQISSQVGNQKVSINDSFMVQPPTFVDVEVPIRQD